MTQAKVTAKSPTPMAGPSTLAPSPSSWQKWWVYWPFTCSSRSTASYEPSPAPSSLRNPLSVAYPLIATAFAVAPVCDLPRPPAEMPRHWGKVATQDPLPLRCQCTPWTHVSQATPPKLAWAWVACSTPRGIFCRAAPSLKTTTKTPTAEPHPSERCWLISPNQSIGVSKDVENTGG